MMALLMLVALVLTIASAFGKCPLWVPVLIIILALLAPSIPLR